MKYVCFLYAVSGADGGEGDACASSYTVCNNIFQKIMDIAGNVNVSIKTGIELISFTCLFLK